MDLNAADTDGCLIIFIFRRFTPNFGHLQVSMTEVVSPHANNPQTTRKLLKEIRTGPLKSGPTGVHMPKKKR